MERIAALCLLLSLANSPAALAAWPPAAREKQIALWPGAAPNARPAEGAEEAVTTLNRETGKVKLVGGKPWMYVKNVARPTMIVYPPKGKDAHAAVIVFPGGGYDILAIDLEGTEACDWLTSRGITCVLLKYRVPCAKTGPYRDCLTALQDAQRAVGIVRHRAAEWHIDPHKIGVLGFSAGGHMVTTISTHFAKRLYPKVDAADNESCRPDFGIALYPGHVVNLETKLVPNPDIRVTSKTPPALLIHAQDDPVDPVENSLVYYAALQKAGVVTSEMHVFAKGGHAFGLRPTEVPITRWPQLAENWLTSIGIIGK